MLAGSSALQPAEVEFLLGAYCWRRQPSPAWPRTDESKVKTHTAIGNKTWVILCWGWEADMNESEHFFSGPGWHRLRPRPGSRFNHQHLRTAQHEGAQWKQFSHYAFIEARPFITFIPGLCPNETQERGWKVMTLRCLSLMGELHDADEADKAAAAFQRNQGRCFTHKPRNDCCPEGSRPSRWLRQLECSEWTRGFRVPSGLLFPDLNSEISKLPVFVSLVSIHRSRTGGSFDSSSRKASR